MLVRQTCATSGVNGIALTKLDVLDGFETLKICVGYELDGERLDYLPTAADQQARCTPIYEEMPGWSESTEGARSWADLPAAAIKYVRRVEELIDCPVALLSTSPEREDTILVTDPFAGLRHKDGRAHGAELQGPQTLVAGDPAGRVAALHHRRGECGRDCSTARRSGSSC